MKNRTINIGVVEEVAQALKDFKNQKRALINDKFVKEGDLLMDQIRVLRINNDAVILGLNNKEYRLHIIENPVCLKQNSRRTFHE